MADEEKKYRAFTGVLWVESESYDSKEVLEMLDVVFEKWAYILHDRDTLETGEVKKAHYQWVGYRKSPVKVKTITKQLGLRAQDVEWAKKGWKAITAYLVHANDPDKYQYSDDDVVANFNYAAEIADKLAVEDKARLIFGFIYSQEGRLDETMLGQWALDNGCWSEFIRAYAFWSKVIKSHDFARNYKGE